MGGWGFILCGRYITPMLLKLCIFWWCFRFSPFDIICATGVWNNPGWNDSDLPSGHTNQLNVCRTFTKFWASYERYIYIRFGPFVHIYFGECDGLLANLPKYVSVKFILFSYPRKQIHSKFLLNSLLRVVLNLKENKTNVW